VAVGEDESVGCENESRTLTVIASLGSAAAATPVKDLDAYDGGSGALDDAAHGP